MSVPSNCIARPLRSSLASSQTAILERLNTMQTAVEESVHAVATQLAEAETQASGCLALAQLATAAERCKHAQVRALPAELT